MTAPEQLGTQTSWLYLLVDFSSSTGLSVSAIELASRQLLVHPAVLESNVVVRLGYRPTTLGKAEGRLFFTCQSVGEAYVCRINDNTEGPDARQGSRMLQVPWIFIFGRCGGEAFWTYHSRRRSKRFWMGVTPIARMRHCEIPTSNTVGACAKGACIDLGLDIVQVVLGILEALKTRVTCSSVESTITRNAFSMVSWQTKYIIIICGNRILVLSGILMRTASSDTLQFHPCDLRRLAPSAISSISPATA